MPLNHREGTAQPAALFRVDKVNRFVSADNATRFRFVLRVQTISIHVYWVVADKNANDGCVKNRFVDGRHAVGRVEHGNGVAFVFLHERQMRLLLVVFFLHRALASDIVFPTRPNVRPANTCDFRSYIVNFGNADSVWELRPDERTPLEEEEAELRMDITDLISEFLPLASKLMLACQLDPLPIPEFRQSFSIVSVVGEDDDIA